MPDYTPLTDDEFDHKLAVIVGELTGPQILAIPGVYEILSEHFNNPVLEWWEEENPVLAHPPIIYDSWANEEDGEPGFADRYTVIPKHGEFAGNGDEGPTLFLGCSQGGLAFSQWGELKGPYDHENYAHLGRRITLDDLDEATRRHVITRLNE